MQHLKSALALSALLGCVALTGPVPAVAQLTPPGLGNANTASWQAVGVRQNLDAIERRESMTYVGIGTASDRLDRDPYGRPAILVLNQEFYDQFREHWLYSVGLSYRRQDAYESEGSEWRKQRFQELRLYGRYASVLSGERWKLINAVRPEVRGFVQPDFGARDQPVQFRGRLKTQLTWKLDQQGVHRLVGAAEELASIARDRTRSAGFTDFNYRESRFSIFYSLHDRRLPFVIDVGYMNNLIGNTKSALIDVHYIAFDLVIINPFGKPGEARGSARKGADDEPSTPAESAQ